MIVLLQHAGGFEEAASTARHHQGEINRAPSD
jgi:hypothetical protein